jgi:phosphatidylserine decarboxylase
MSFSMIDSVIKTMMVKPHAAGIPFIIGGAAATVVFAVIVKFLAVIALIFTVFCLYFFRDPERVTPQKASLIVAPGDGVVSAITGGVPLPAEVAGDSQEKFIRISIFLSVLDVHVNRIPIGGKIVRRQYKGGKFFNADLDKASEENERSAAIIETAGGLRICVVQIAGLIARRIINDMKKDQAVETGARFGIIRFGSRVDVYMPENIAPLVCVGQRAVGGETVLADIDGHEPARKGAIV